MGHELLLAYIDPVSGSILIQAIIAGVLGAFAFFRRSIFRVTRLVFRRDPARSSDASEQDSGTGTSTR